MESLEPDSSRAVAASVTNPRRPSSEPSRQRGKNSPTRIAIALLIAVGATAAAYAVFVGPEKFKRDVEQALSHIPGTRRPAGPGDSVARPGTVKPVAPWDGHVRVAEDDAKMMGLSVATVQPQRDPIILELQGRTDYDPNRLSKIRPRFDTLVEQVHAEFGQKVKKGDPLVDLFSTELAAAKNDFQTTFVQWQHDLTLRTLRESLFKSNRSISEQLLVDTRNEENKSRLNVKVAREKLRVFGVPDDQVDPLTKSLNPQELPRQDELHSVSEKARMTRLSPIDGIVIVRDVVPGNFYDSNDVLMIISPLDHLFVWVNVYEADQSHVYNGQRMQVRFPYLDETIPATVQYVAAEVSKETRAIKIRATVPNADGRLKADMLVRASLEVPPVSGWVVIPRLAMVVMNGNEFAFVRKPRESADEPERFERKRIVVAEERDDHVVVKEGVKAGEEVATSGSLILAQLFEEQQMVATGMPPK